jgi:hypothetical protein
MSYVSSVEGGCALNKTRSYVLSDSEKDDGEGRAVVVLSLRLRLRLLNG